jgi:hypothetical protein
VAFRNIITRENRAMPLRKSREFARENPDRTEAHVEVGDPVDPRDIEEVQRRGFSGQAVSNEDKSQYTVEGVTSRASQVQPGVETHGLDVSGAEGGSAGEPARGRRARHETSQEAQQ